VTAGAGGTGRRVIVDGVTGHVGSNFVSHVQRCGDGAEVIALSRGDPGRVHAAIDGAVVEQGGDRPPTERVRVAGYALDRADMGLDQPALRELFDRPCDYWHFAARVDLSPTGLGELVATNVEGTRNTLDVFCRCARPGSRYFMVSTAYSCGHVDAPVAERWHPTAPPSAFRTYYEATKRAAEHLVRDAFQERGVAGAVLRLGQVVGSSVTGRTTSVYGMYDFLRMMRRLTSRRPNEEVRIEAAADATLSLVPIDRCVAWLWSIATAPTACADPPIFHVVDQVPVPARRVTDIVSDHLPVSIRLTPPAEMRGTELTLLERLVAARMSYMGKYISSCIEFRRDNLVKAVGDEGVVVTDEVLDRLIRTFLADDGER
jgi:nucleoside-diphosphate-sugar epimerase